MASNISMREFLLKRSTSNTKGVLVAKDITDFRDIWLDGDDAAVLTTSQRKTAMLQIAKCLAGKLRTDKLTITTKTLVSQWTSDLDSFFRQLVPDEEMVAECFDLNSLRNWAHLCGAELYAAGFSSPTDL